MGATGAGQFCLFLQKIRRTSITLDIEHRTCTEGGAEIVIRKTEKFFRCHEISAGRKYEYE
jgi:hypothetical protein